MRRLALVALAALLVACGASDRPYNRVVSFGDSLSDVGTYQPAVGALGGGKFTVNGFGPRVWTEWLAGDLGLDVSPAQRGGVTLSIPVFTVFPAVAAEGDSWAQGGARIDAPGITLTPGVTLTSMSIRQQIDRFLAAPGATSSQTLFLLNGGGNDIGFLGQAVLGGAITPEQARLGVVQAAQQMAAQARRLLLLGTVVLLNQADGSLAPVASSAAIRALYLDLTPRFNAALAAALEGSAVVLVDQFSLGRRIVADPAAFGFINTTDPACKLDALPLRSAIVCTESTLVAQGAAVNYLWSDTLHTTPAYHRHLATLAMTALRDGGRL